MPVDVSATEFLQKRSFQFPKRGLYWLLAQLWVWLIVAALFVIPSMTKAAEQSQNVFQAKTELLLGINLFGTLESEVQALEVNGMSCRILTNIHATCDGELSLNIKNRAGSLTVTTGFSNLVSAGCATLESMIECFRENLGDQIIRERRAGSNLRMFDFADTTLSVSPQIVSVSVR